MYTWTSVLLNNMASSYFTKVSVYLFLGVKLNLWMTQLAGNIVRADEFSTFFFFFWMHPATCGILASLQGSNLHLLSGREILSHWITSEVLNSSVLTTDYSTHLQRFRVEKSTFWTQSEKNYIAWNLEILLKW